MAGRTGVTGWWRREEPPRQTRTVNVGRRERLASAVLGGLLALLGTSRRGWAWRLLAVAGGALLLRAVTGHSRAYESAGISSAGLGEGAGITLDESVTVEAPLENVFGFWRHPGTLPAYLSHIVAVDETCPGRTHWVLDTPAEDPFTFDAEVIDERENELIAWRTLPGSEIEHAGSVQFSPAPAGNGTDVRVRLRYVPPAGAAGFAAARAASGLVERGVVEDLQRFRDALEGGDTVVGHARPRGDEAMAMAGSRSTESPGVPLEEA